MRLAELRKAAGLSQYELARYTGVPQANIAFWERSANPPRSEALPKMAEALGVSVEDLLIMGDEKPLKKKAAKSNGRPAGKVREVFERVSKAPPPPAGAHRQLVAAYVQTRSLASKLTSTDDRNLLLRSPKNFRFPPVAGHQKSDKYRLRVAHLSQLVDP